MKAAALTSFGTPSDAFSYIDVEMPEPKKDEVRLKILATGLNRIDHYLRQGDVNPDINFPHILGSDAVATIDALGEDVKEFSVGERVIAMPGYPTKSDDIDFNPMSAAPSYAIRGVSEWGAYGEYMVIPARWVVADTTGLPAEEVATLPMPLVTCVRAVKVVGEAKAGDIVLIHGAASGTGSVSVQVAKALGAQVIATIRTPKKEDFVRSLGADLIIRTETEDFVDMVMQWTDGKGVDVVVDNLGGTIFEQSLNALKPLGILVSMGMVTGMQSSIDLFPFFFSQKQIRGTLMGDMQDLLWGIEQVKAGKIKPTLDKVYPLNKAHEAHERLALGQACGTIVLKP